MIERNREIEVSPEVQKILDGPSRNPCTYCGENHLEYACDKQIEYLKTLIKSKKCNSKQ
jgi:hypothetical protein